MVKKEIRIIGIDDSPFNKFKDKNSLVVAVVMRGGLYVDGILTTKVDVDGHDATEKIADMISQCKFLPQLQCIFLDGIAVAGFNVIDVKQLHEKTKLPVIVVIRRMPDVENVKKTLLRLGKREKAELIEKAGQIKKIGNVFVQLTGIGEEKAERILKIVCTRSFVPEPVRLAHMIASGIVFGESKGGS